MVVSQTSTISIVFIIMRCVLNIQVKISTIIVIIAGLCLEMRVIQIVLLSLTELIHNIFVCVSSRLRNIIVFEVFQCLFLLQLKVVIEKLELLILFILKHFLHLILSKHAF